MELYRLKYINPKLSEETVITVYSQSKMLLHEYLEEQTEKYKDEFIIDIKLWIIDKAYITKNGICLNIWHRVEESKWLKEIGNEQINEI